MVCVAEFRAVREGLVRVRISAVGRQIAAFLALAALTAASLGTAPLAAASGGAAPSADFEAVCGPEAPGTAQCLALRRTDIGPPAGSAAFPLLASPAPG